MSERTCKKCGVDINHLHRFSKYCDEHKPTKPVRKTNPAKTDRVAAVADDPDMEFVIVPKGSDGVKLYVGDPVVKADVTPEQRAAFKEASAPVETIVEQRVREIRESREGRRVNIGGHVTRLDAKLPPGMKGRWVNDVNGRPKYLQDERGYTFVAEGMEGVQAHNTGMGGNISQIVGTQEGGGGMSGVLMMIPEEIYEEDQATKRKALDEIDGALHRGESLDPESEHDTSHRYGDLTISRD